MIALLCAFTALHFLVQSAYPDASSASTLFSIAGFALIVAYAFSVTGILSLPTWFPRLLTILLVGFAVRIAWADHPGFSYDMSVNKLWTKSAVILGIARSYVEQLNGNQLPSYPPLSIIIFATAGKFYQAIWSPTFDDTTITFHVIIKLPAILADLGITTLAFFFLKRWSVTAGLVGATLYALHPAAIHDSAIWGQTDSIYTFAAFAAAFAASRKQWTWAGVLTAAACLLKPQAAPVFLMLSTIVLFCGYKSVLRYVAGGIGFTFLVLIPFVIGGTLPQAMGVYNQAVGVHFSNITQNAFNLWYSLYGCGTNRDDTQLFLGIIQYRRIGFLLFALAFMWTVSSLRHMLKPAKGNEKNFALAVMLACALASYAFFILLTQMHERYMFAYIALALPLIVTGRRGIVLHLLSSFLFWFNLFDLLAYGGQPVIDFLLELSGRSVFTATLQTTTFVLTCIHVHEYFRREGKSRPGIFASIFVEITNTVSSFLSPFFRP